jgi:hypothetical protein
LQHHPFFFLSERYPYLSTSALASTSWNRPLSIKFFAISRNGASTFVFVFAERSGDGAGHQSSIPRLYWTNHHW